MARSRTATALIDDVRKRADIESVTDRFPDAEILEYINQSIAKLYTNLDLMDHTYYRSSSSITTVAGTSSYALPDDFWHAKKVSTTINGKPYTLKRFNPLEEDVLERVAWQTQFPEFYELSGSNIILRPVPASGYTVSIYYSQAPVRLVAGADTFDGIAGFEEWVVLNAAIKTRRKNRQDATDLQADAGETWAWIETTGHDRDHGQPMQICDAQDILDGHIGPWPIGRV
jgi:hypothetical protein